MVSIEGSLLRFSGPQELRDALDAYGKVIDCVRDHSAVVLDFDDAAEVDLTLIQLIESARISVAREGKTLRLSAPASGALLAALERGGFVGEPTDPRTQFWLAA